MLSDTQVTFLPPPNTKKAQAFKSLQDDSYVKNIFSHIIDKNFPLIPLGKYYIY